MTCGNSLSPSGVSSTHPVRVIFERSFSDGPREAHLVHPVRLAHERVGQSERLEHLDRAACNAVGVPDLQRLLAALDDARGDVGELGELRREHGSRGPGAHDQHVDLIGEDISAICRLRRGNAKVGVSGAVSVAVELHQISFDHSGPVGEGRPNRPD